MGRNDKGRNEGRLVKRTLLFTEEGLSRASKPLRKLEYEIPTPSYLEFGLPESEMANAFMQGWIMGVEFQAIGFDAGDYYCFVVPKFSNWRYN